MVSISCKNCIYDDVDTVFFDKDGTFIDSHIYWGRIIERRVRHIIQDFQLKDNYYDDLCLAMGYSTKDKCLVPQGPIALLPRSDVISAVVTKLNDYGLQADEKFIEQIFQVEHKLFHNEMYDYIRLLDYSEFVFKTLKSKGVKLAVITSDSVYNTEKTLEYLKIKKYFDLVIGKESCDSPKRTGKPALVALEKLNSQPQNTIAVGDAKMDSDMAKNAGLKGCVLVSTGQSQISELEQYSDFAIKSIGELEIK